MRFPVVFFRQLGGGVSVPGGVNPALGSDSAPSPLADGATNPSLPTAETSASADNALSVRHFTSQGGFPQRVAVLYGYTGAGSAPALTASLYFLEETTGLWFLIGTAHTLLTVGGVTFFDCLSIADSPPFAAMASNPGMTAGQAIGSNQPSAGRYLLVVDKVGSVNGQYYFGMAPVLTSSP